MHLHQHQHHHLLQPQNSITLRCHPLSPSPSVLSPSPWHRRAPSTMSSPSRMGSMSETTLTATRYNRASYSLTNQPDALKVYRAMAEKTGDPMVQFTYAKYLLEVAALYEESDPKKKTNTKGQRATDNASRTHIAHPLTTPSESQRRKKKMFEDEGVRWIKRLTKEGMGGAAFLQAQWMDEERYGFKRNRTKSRKLYQLAAKADIPEALYIVAEYDEAAGFLDHAFTRYQKAAIQGYPPALLRLAQVHLHGELHQQQNIALGLETLREASEKATDACPEAPFLFGQILTCSYAKARIPNELLYQYGGRAVGVRYFAQAAHWGYLPALVRCGHIFEHGLEGEPMDLARSFGYYDQAARVHNDPQAMLGLSRLYNRGCHGPADDSDASQREQRDVSGWLIHMERNEDGAFAWCRRAADLGHVEAIFLLGWYYETGVGVLRDYAQARTCYRRAAVKGHAGAKERLSKTNSMTRQQHEVMKASSSSQDKMCRVM
ncbi:hypothetical protein BCR43DRAFT_477807 [Syncephalastrum racemosum]|uniref:HCP-like protein n=1 Tax=Syncephalastrum racemosum TaxID=13706 RepID=A0A1X2H703_SYNRA|nr:hypothetical protein BCR43DRAFT_477807 [Syncephalastrum racemosum]